MKTEMKTNTKLSSEIKEKTRSAIRRNHSKIEGAAAEAYFNMAVNCFKPYYNVYCKLIDSIFRNARDPLRFLDFGTGPGIINNVILSNCSTPLKITAIDNSKKMLNLSEKYNEDFLKESKLELIYGDERILKELNGRFDIIFLRDIIHHIGRLKPFLNDVFKILSENGILLIEDLKLYANLKYAQNFTNILFDKMENVNHQIYDKIIGFLDSIRSAYNLDEVELELDRLNVNYESFEGKGRFFILSARSDMDLEPFAEEWKTVLKNNLLLIEDNNA
ncbi:MAG: class I SAM-dependent methyltransferase [Candidatus Aminicenantes bacterium]|nr:class I SAM-dependent methyltransferase [Candidatus Aminicenantes bacterium]